MPGKVSVSLVPSAGCTKVGCLLLPLLVFARLGLWTEAKVGEMSIGHKLCLYQAEI